MSIKILDNNSYKNVYRYLLQITDSKYISKIIVDAALEYNRRKKEELEEAINKENILKQQNKILGIKICPRCGKYSEEKRNVCEHCF